MNVAESTYPIAHRACYQGARPLVFNQAGVEKCDTGSERPSLPPNQRNEMTKTSRARKGNRQSKDPKYFKWKAGQINIQTCSDDFRLHDTIDQCEKANLDIVCIQEFRRLGEGSLSYKGYDIYWTGKKYARQHDVAIAL